MKKGVWFFIVVVLALACQTESVKPAIVSKYHVTGKWDMAQSCDQGGCTPYAAGFLYIEMTSDSLFNTYVKDTLRLADHYRLKMKNDSVGYLTIYATANDIQNSILEKDSLFIKYGAPKYSLTLKSVASSSTTLYKKR